MKKSLKHVLLVTAIGSMGFTMPSCPGQEETQHKMESLQQANAELARKVQSMDTQITSLNNDMAQVKQLLPQITNVIQSQKGTLDEHESSIKALQQPKIVKKGFPPRVLPKKK